MKKRKIVLSDKAKIASVIAELDEKKNEALRKAYDQVNKVSIFRLTIGSLTSGPPVFLYFIPFLYFPLFSMKKTNCVINSVKLMQPFELFVLKYVIVFRLKGE
jgi:hypothetical protein